MISTVLPFVFLLVGRSVATECTAPLSLKVNAFDYWNGYINGVPFNGPRLTDGITGNPYDKLQDITMWLPRGVFVIGITVYNNPNHLVNGFIASMSWNGLRISNSSTGTSESLWKFALSTAVAEAGWNTDTTFNDISFRYAKDSISCPSLSNMTNSEGINIADYISNNGVSSNYVPSSNWIGVGSCSNAGPVYYRLVIDTTGMDPAPCYPSSDYRSRLSGTNSIFTTRLVGAPQPSTTELKIRFASDDVWTMYFNNFTVASAQGYEWYRFSDNVFQVPSSQYLFAARIHDFGGGRFFGASFVYNGTVIALSDNLLQWKIYAGNSQINSPPAGWNTDLNFNDSNWMYFNDSMFCSYTSWPSTVLSMDAGCAKVGWYPSCSAESPNVLYPDLYVRFKLDLRPNAVLPQIPCDAVKNYESTKSVEHYVSTSSAAAYPNYASTLSVANYISTSSAYVFQTSHAQECKAPLVVKMNAMDQYSSVIDLVGLDGPRSNDAVKNPVDVLQDYITWDIRGKIVLAFQVSPINSGMNSFIASVSWNGIQINGSLTGTLGSNWKYTTNPSLLQSGWSTNIYFDDSAWNSADKSISCDYLSNSTNIDGINYVNHVSSNGDSSGSQASWVGVNNCQESKTVYYRLLVDTQNFAPASCYPASDYRSQLNTNTIFFNQTLGTANDSTASLTIRVIGDDQWESYFNGKAVVYRSSWNKFTDLNFQVLPKQYLFASHVNDLGGRRMFGAGITYNGSVIALSDTLSQWKIYANGSTPPPQGWNTDLNFNDSSWISVNSTYSCKIYSSIFTNIISMNVGCGSLFWYPTCTEESPPQYPDLYVRFKLDLTPGAPQPAVPCDRRIASSTSARFYQSTSSAAAYSNYVSTYSAATLSAAKYQSSVQNFVSTSSIAASVANYLSNMTYQSSVSNYLSSSSAVQYKASASNYVSTLSAAAYKSSVSDYLSSGSAAAYQASASNFLSTSSAAAYQSSVSDFKSSSSAVAYQASASNFVSTSSAAAYQSSASQYSSSSSAVAYQASAWNFASTLSAAIYQSSVSDYLSSSSAVVYQASASNFASTLSAAIYQSSVSDYLSSSSAVVYQASASNFVSTISAAAYQSSVSDYKSSSSAVVYQASASNFVSTSSAAAYQSSVSQYVSSSSVAGFQASVSNFQSTSSVAVYQSSSSANAFQASASNFVSTSSAAVYQSSVSDYVSSSSIVAFQASISNYVSTQSVATYLSSVSGYPASAVVHESTATNPQKDAFIASTKTIAAYQSSVSDYVSSSSLYAYQASASNFASTLSAAAYQTSVSNYLSTSSVDAYKSSISNYISTKSVADYVASVSNYVSTSSGFVYQTSASNFVSTQSVDDYRASVSVYLSSSAAAYHSSVSDYISSSSVVGFQASVAGYQASVSKFVSTKSAAAYASSVSDYVSSSSAVGYQASASNFVSTSSAAAYVSSVSDYVSSSSAVGYQASASNFVSTSSAAVYQSSVSDYVSSSSAVGYQASVTNFVSTYSAAAYGSSVSNYVSSISAVVYQASASNFVSTSSAAVYQSSVSDYVSSSSAVGYQASASNFVSTSSAAVYQASVSDYISSGSVVQFQASVSQYISTSSIAAYQASLSDFISSTSAVAYESAHSTGVTLIDINNGGGSAEEQMNINTDEAKAVTSTAATTVATPVPSTVVVVAPIEVTTDLESTTEFLSSTVTTTASSSTTTAGNLSSTAKVDAPHQDGYEDFTGSEQKKPNQASVLVLTKTFAGNVNDTGKAQANALSNAAATSQAAGRIAAAGSLILVAIIGAAIGFLVFKRLQQRRSFEQAITKNLGLGVRNPLYDDQVSYKGNPLVMKPAESSADRNESLIDSI